MPEITKTDLETRGTPRWFWWVFFALTIFVYFFGLTVPLVGPDEPRYAEVAREMFARGDWITPTLGGANWFEKPALLYWLEIVSYHIFGVNEFAARFGSALCGLGTIFSLWIIGKFVGMKTGDFANWLALIAASTLGIIVFSRGASFDIIVTFPITASLAGFIVYDSIERRPKLALFCFYFFIGVALLAKGLIGLVFPFGIVALFFILSRRWPRRDFLLSLLWGVPLLIIVASTWYVPMYLRHGYTFIDEFIIQQHFQRFTSNKYQHPQPFYFFFWVLPLMTIPWIPFFFVAIWKSIGSLASKIRSEQATKEPVDNATGENLRLFAWAWLLVPLVFFSFSGSKLPGYILPAVPAAILLLAEQVFRLFQKHNAWQRIISFVAVGTYVVVVFAIIFVVPGFARKETVKGLVETADSKGYSNLSVAGFIVVSHNAEFYSAGRLIRDADGKQHRFVGAHEIDEYIRSHNGMPILVLAPREDVKALTNNEILQAQVLDENGELAIVLVTNR